MAFALGTQGTGIGTTNAVDTTGLNLICLYEVYDGAGTVSDNKGNTWTSVITVGTGIIGQMYYAVSPTVGTGHKFVTSVSYGAILMNGYTATSPSLDVSNGTHAVVATSKATGAVTPTVDNELVLTGIGFGGALNAADPSIDLGFGTNIFIPPLSGVSYGGAMAKLVEGVGSSVNPTWSWTNNADISTAIVSFQEAAVASGISSYKNLTGVGI